MKNIFTFLLMISGTLLFAQNNVSNETLLNKILWSNNDFKGNYKIYISSFIAGKDSMTFNFLITTDSKSNTDFILYRAICDGMKDVRYTGINKNKIITITEKGEKRFSLKVPNSASFILFDGFKLSSIDDCKALIKIKSNNNIPDIVNKMEIEKNNIINLSSIMK
ncbi:MAG: hypothetical protein HY951_14200 [Bacteroidia bacterium]|nr:hypothetical protein [Bacteroidia bacterium]